MTPASLNGNGCADAVPAAQAYASTMAANNVVFMESSLVGPMFTVMFMGRQSDMNAVSLRGSAKIGSAGHGRALAGPLRPKATLKGDMMAKLGLAVSAAVAAAWLSVLPLRGEGLVPGDAKPYGQDLLARVRVAATVIPGPLPTRINYLKIAESHRPLAEIIEGGSQENYVSARTAFQVVYGSGNWAMVDSGMDQAVHKFFGFGREEPYWPERNAAVQEAVRKAKLVVVTHEHGDHAAGVIRSDARKEIAAKTLLTQEQVRTLIQYPQMPEIRLTPEMARDYIVVDYEAYLPVAPGIVLIKAPGHTPGHQMVYVRLDSGTEYLLIGDVAWSLANVTELKLRSAATMRRINESAPALLNQLRWIKEVMDREKIVVIPSHDDILLHELAAKQIIGAELVRQ
jgi:glyoxylase-like metal-dependent hydrolase (beta-lactamase superfamily II)